jgi:hypothetical protein
MSFTFPSGTTLTPLTDVCIEFERSRQLGQKLVAQGRIDAILIGQKWFVTEPELRRLRRDGWPAERNPEARSYWNEWRAFRRQQMAGAAA